MNHPIAARLGCDSECSSRTVLNHDFNIAASLLMFYFVYVSGMPADEEHHYGHEKIENISSLI